VRALYGTPIPVVFAVGLGIVFLVATYRGLVLTLRAARRGWPLVPSLSAILMLLLLGEPRSFVDSVEAVASFARLARVLDAAPPYWAGVHALLCLAIAARWFLIERRRFGPLPAAAFALAERAR